MTHPPSTVAWGPTQAGPGTGRSFWFFNGFSCRAARDRGHRSRQLPHLADDVAALRASGYRVVVELCGDGPRLDAALRGTHPDSAGTALAGFCWTGHGEAGEVHTHDGQTFGPDAIGDVSAAATCRLAVFACCWTGLSSEKWQAKLGAQAHVHGWWRPVSVVGNIEFFTPDEKVQAGFDDLLVQHLGAARPGVLASHDEAVAMFELDRAHAAHWNHNPHLHARPTVGAKVRAQWHDGDYHPAQLVSTDGRRFLAKMVDTWLDYPPYWVTPWQIRPLDAPGAG